MREVRAQFLPEGHRPASTMVGVTSLVNPDLLVEVEVIASLARPALRRRVKQLDPQARAVLERVARANLPPYPQLGAAGARQLYRETRGALAAPPPEVESVEDLHAPGPAGDIRVRLYRPRGAADAGPLPVLVYFHGGGWTIGDLDTHDVRVPRARRSRALRGRVGRLPARAGAQVPRRGRRRGRGDALGRARSRARSGSTRARIAVGGDSAGGNLAAVVAIAFRDDGRAAARDADADLSRDRHGGRHALAPALRGGHLLTRDAILWFRGNYLRDAGGRGRLARLAAEAPPTSPGSRPPT